MQKRPEFTLLRSSIDPLVNDDPKKYIIKSSGILFFTISNNEIYILMINKGYTLEDFGGKSDVNDKSIYDIACREAAEESNNIFPQDELYNCINNSLVYHINPKAKYCLYFIYLDELIDVKQFGDEEIHGKIKRTVKWISLSEFEKGDITLHPRLLKKDICKWLNKIKG